MPKISYRAKKKLRFTPRKWFVHTFVRRQLMQKLIFPPFFICRSFISSNSDSEQFTIRSGNSGHL